MRDIDPRTGERRQTSGITTRLLLTYVRRQAGPGAVDEVLRRCGLEGRAEDLLDERTWWSLDTKLRLFEAAADVLDDPHVTRRAGELALKLNVGAGLKLALRGLGSPRMVYDNIVKANDRFSTAHRMELLELAGDRARLRYRRVEPDAVYHSLDCDYNLGLLSCIPLMFGLPAARIEHVECAVRGAPDGCVYDIAWESGGNPVRAAVGGGAALAVAAGGALLFAPPALPGVLLAGVAALGWGSLRRGDRLRRRLVELERVVNEQAGVVRQVGASLQELVTDLDEREVLDKITAGGAAALGVRDLALLVDGGEGLVCRSTTGLPAGAEPALEAWAAGLTATSGVVLVEDLATAVPALARFGASLCAAPLLYRGRGLGLLVALAPGSQSFLPRDRDLLQAYASQGAIALANARLFRAQQELATRDGLTSLLNHREFHETVERELARGHREERPLSVVLLDLDDFKLINDSHGHAEGDRVLRTVAGALEGVCREGDLAFRVGGDELALVLPGSGAAGAELVARRAVKAMLAVDRRARASFGIACAPVDGAGKDELLGCADARLYAMKRIARAA